MNRDMRTAAMMVVQHMNNLKVAKEIADMMEEEILYGMNLRLSLTEFADANPDEHFLQNMKDALSYTYKARTSGNKMTEQIRHSDESIHSPYPMRTFSPREDFEIPAVTSQSEADLANICD